MSQSIGQAPPTPIATPTSLHESFGPVYPIPIPDERFAKAVQLYKTYLYEKKLNPGDARQLPDAITSRDGQIIDSYRSGHSINSTNSAQSDYSYGSSVCEGILLDGREKQRPRKRRRLLPLEKAKSALVRCLGSCSACRRKRVPCPLEHHDIERLEKALYPQSRGRESSLNPQANPQRGRSESCGANPSSRVIRRLRCHFNALYPHIFCVNSETKNQYHVCSKAGYLTVAHLKQHNKSTHTAHRCERCGDLFRTVRLRDAHLLREPDKMCNVKPEEDWPGIGQAENINNVTQQRISKILSARGQSQLEPDVVSALNAWVSANLSSYAGPDALPQDRLELKNWYLIWKALFLDVPVPRHPFFDNLSEAMSEDEKLISAFQSRVNDSMSVGQMATVSAELLSQLTDRLRESQAIVRSTQHSSTVRTPALSHSQTFGFDMIATQAPDPHKSGQAGQKPSNTDMDPPPSKRPHQDLGIGALFDIFPSGTSYSPSALSWLPTAVTQLTPDIGPQQWEQIFGESASASWPTDLDQEAFNNPTAPSTGAIMTTNLNSSLSYAEHYTNISTPGGLAAMYSMHDDGTYYLRSSNYQASNDASQAQKMWTENGD